MCVGIHVCTYICMHVCTECVYLCHACMYACTVCIYVCMCLYVFVWMDVCMYVNEEFKCMYMYVCMYVSNVLCVP